MDKMDRQIGGQPDRTLSLSFMHCQSLFPSDYGYNASTLDASRCVRDKRLPVYHPTSDCTAGEPLNITNGFVLYRAVCLSVCPLIELSVCLFVCSCNCVICLSVCLSVCQYIYFHISALFHCNTVCLSVCLSVCFVCLFV